MAELGGGGTCDRWDAINATFTSKPIQTLFSIWLVFIFVLLSTKWEGVNFFFVEKDHIFLWISIPKVVLYDTKTFRYLFIVRWSLSSSVWDDHYHHISTVGGWWLIFYLLRQTLSSRLRISCTETQFWKWCQESHHRQLMIWKTVFWRHLVYLMPVFNLSCLTNTLQHYL